MRIFSSKKTRIWLLKALESSPRSRAVTMKKTTLMMVQLLRKMRQLEVEQKLLASESLGTTLTIMRSRQSSLRIACMRRSILEAMTVDQASSDQRSKQRRTRSP